MKAWLTPFKKGESHPNWKGGIILHNQGYLYQLAPTHPRKNKGNRVAVHRLVMESHLGRLLSPNEDVHHINRDKTDNRIENLLLLSHSDHRKLELKGEINKWAINYDKCKICGSSEHKHNAHGYCKWCYNKALKNSQVIKEVCYL